MRACSISHLNFDRNMTKQELNLVLPFRFVVDPLPSRGLKHHKIQTVKDKESELSSLKERYTKREEVCTKYQCIGRLLITTSSLCQPLNPLSNVRYAWTFLTNLLRKLF